MKRCLASSLIREMAVVIIIVIIIIITVKKIKSMGDNVDKLEPIAGGNVKWCRHCGKWFGSSSA